MSPSPTAPELTGLARLVLAILDQAPGLGLDPAELMREASIDELDLSDPDSRVPFAKTLRLWRAIVERRPDPTVGLRLGAAVTVRELGLVGYAMAHSATLGEAWRRFSRYCRIISDAIRVHIAEAADRARVDVEAHPALDALRHPVNARLACMLAVSREITGTDVTPVEVSFPYPRPPSTRDYARVFGCALRFGRPPAAIVFRREQMGLPIAASDPTLAGYLDELASEKVRSLTQEESLSGKVRQAMWRRLSTGAPSLSQIASDLAISERSLQRRLRRHGTSFASLLEDLRREVATELLGDRRLAVYELAFLLGYSEPSAFNRAFRRWTGSSPLRYRAGMAGGGRRAAGNAASASGAGA